MSYHIDARVERALTALNDEICSFERATAREYTLLLIPHSPDEVVFVSRNGKPLSGNDPRQDLSEFLSFALRARIPGSPPGQQGKRRT